MRKSFVLWVLLGLLGTVAIARADTTFDAGVKLWYAEPKVTDRAMMYGPAARLVLDSRFWVSGNYLYGEYDYVRSSAPRIVQDFGLHDAELMAGVNWDIFDFGFGARWMAVLMEEPTVAGTRVRRPNAFGPVFSVGASQSFADWPWGFEGSPWGWFADASWMFYDAEDDDGEHLNVEVGVTHESYGVHKRIGYRFKETFDHEQMEGFTASLLFEF